MTLNLANKLVNEMITKKYSKKNVSEPKIMVGFVSVTFLFLALICAIDPSPGQRMEVFAQEVNNTNASSLTIGEELEPIQVDFVSNIEHKRTAKTAYTKSSIHRRAAITHRK